MKARELSDGIHWVGAIDWDRRMFDSLIPIPDGTSYNSYLVRGSDKTALIDTVEPHFADVLFARLEDAGVERLDYVVANHAEQDHSGSLPLILQRFPEARILCTPKCRDMVCDLMPLPRDAFDPVDDGDVVDLGGRSLRFIHFPWVHWPETMLTSCPEARTLFPCDLFGSHLATNELVASDPSEVIHAARLYYAQIMMPFRKQIARRMASVEELELDRICPSHGPVHGDPSVILDAYRGWVSDDVCNTVVLPFISMHESTRILVDWLIDALTDRGIKVERFNLESVDSGKMASALVDAATVVIATPTVLGGPHPNALYAANLANLLRPKTRFMSVIGSFGWGGKAADQLKAAMPNIRAELLEPAMVRGRPGDEAREAIDSLAERIAARHAELS